LLGDVVDDDFERLAGHADALGRSHVPRIASRKGRRRNEESRRDNGREGRRDNGAHREARTRDGHADKQNLSPVSVVAARREKGLVHVFLAGLEVAGKLEQKHLRRLLKRKAPKIHSVQLKFRAPDG